jgi:hypothetical protein
MRGRSGMARVSRRNEFLAKMFEEAMRAYEHPGEEWSEDEVARATEL